MNCWVQLEVQPQCIVSGAFTRRRLENEESCIHVWILHYDLNLLYPSHCQLIVDNPLIYLKEQPVVFKGVF